MTDMNKIDDMMHLARNSAAMWHRDESLDNPRRFKFPDAEAKLRTAIEQALADAREAGQKDGVIKGAMYALDHKPVPDAQPVAWVVFVGNEKMKAFDTLRDAEDWARTERLGHGSRYVYHIRTAYTQPVEQSPEQPANLR